jgi:hypothetical protein
MIAGRRRFLHQKRLVSSQIRKKRMLPWNRDQHRKRMLLPMTNKQPPSSGQYAHTVDLSSKRIRLSYCLKKTEQQP